MVFSRKQDEDALLYVLTTVMDQVDDGPVMRSIKEQDTNFRLVVLYTTGEDTTVVAQNFRLWNRRIRTIDAWVVGRPAATNTFLTRLY